MKVIIAGGRSFNNYEWLKETCDRALSATTKVEIVSGTARGADKLGEIYAEERGFDLIKFPANWEEFGKAAGHRRNFEMAQYADALIVFWDGKSKGTANMIECAEREGLKIKKIIYGVS